MGAFSNGCRLSPEKTVSELGRTELLQDFAVVFATGERNGFGTMVAQPGGTMASVGEVGNVTIQADTGIEEASVLANEATDSLILSGLV